MFQTVAIRGLMTPVLYPVTERGNAAFAYTGSHFQRTSRHIGSSSTLTHAGATARDYRAHTNGVDPPPRKTKAVNKGGRSAGWPPIPLTSSVERLRGSRSCFRNNPIPVEFQRV